MSESPLFKEHSLQEIEKAFAKVLHQIADHKYQVHIVEVSFDQGPSGVLNDITELRMVVRRRPKYKL